MIRGKDDKNKNGGIMNETVLFVIFIINKSHKVRISFRLLYSSSSGGGLLGGSLSDWLLDDGLLGNLLD